MSTLNQGIKIGNWSGQISSQLKMQVIAIGLVLGTYLVWTPGLMDEWHVGRFVWLSLTGIAALILLGRQTDDLRLDKIAVMLSVYYLWSMTTLWWTNTPSAGLMAGQNIFLTVLAYMLFRNTLPILTDLFYYRLWTVVALITLGVTGWQLVDQVLAGGLGAQNMYTIKGLSAHKNLLATYLVFLVGIQAYYMQRLGFSVWRAVVPGLMLITLFVIRSRTALLALGVMLVVVVGYVFFSRVVHRRILLFKIMPVALALVVVSVLLFFGLGGTKQDMLRLWPTQYLKPGDSGSERLFIWIKTAGMIRDRPLTGCGLGNWKIMFPAYGLEGAYRFQSQNVIPTRAHNDFMEIWAETGLVGLGFYLAVFILALWGLGGTYKASAPGERTGIVLLMAQWLAYMVIAGFDFPKERIEHQVYLSWLLALTVHRVSSGLPEFFAPVQWSRTGWRIGVLGAGLLLGFNLVLGYYLAKGENHTLKAITYNRQKQWTRSLEEARQAYSPWFQITPLGTPVKWVEGLSYYYAGQWAGAEASFRQAINHSPYFFPLLNDLAGCLVQSGKLEQAEQTYRSALAINPRFEEGRFNLSFVLAQLGRFDHALNQLDSIKGSPERKEEFRGEIERLRAEGK